MASHGSSFQKTFMGAAGSGGASLDITDVFSTYLYTGTYYNEDGDKVTVNNGIDLTEGGLVWLKSRENTRRPMLFDTERGASVSLSSNSTGANQSGDPLDSFTSTGFVTGDNYETNEQDIDFASWTFRKAPKFFDIVTWTGNDSGRQIAHNLGVKPGCVIVKCTTNTFDWAVWHQGMQDNDPNGALQLNGTSASTAFNGEYWSSTGSGNNTEPTDAVFTVSGAADVNRSGETYVAYLFAHNDGDGEFGPDADQDIIKCGSYTGNNSTNGPEIDLGFEPQWLMIKNITATSGWWMWDTMRGIVTSTNGVDDAGLRANTTTAEALANRLHVTSTGFKLTSSASPVNDNNTFIYMAIRRGPLAPPESATEVFAIDTLTAASPTNGSNASFTAGFAPDMALWRTVDTTANNLIASRLTQSKLLYTNLTNAESTSTNGAYYFNKENGWFTTSSSDADSYSWMWKRAPSYFDVVAYTGSGVAGRTVSHNLGVAPEMMWIKARDLSSDDWAVYSAELGNTKHMRINGNDDAFTSTNIWNATSPSITEFTLGTLSEVNRNGNDYIAYLFATLAGISKVGSVSHSGSSTDVNCGFSAGARFVMLKRTDATGGWYIWDSVRGIIAGNDPYLLLNSTAAEVTNTDYIDPLSSGFQISGAFTDGDYIFYAIA